MFRNIEFGYYPECRFENRNAKFLLLEGIRNFLFICRGLGYLGIYGLYILCSMVLTQHSRIFYNRICENVLKFWNACCIQFKFHSGKIWPYQIQLDINQMSDRRWKYWWWTSCWRSCRTRILLSYKITNMMWLVNALNHSLKLCDTKRSRFPFFHQ